jgi:nucleotide-binding universal stress UspA family protein
MALNDIIVYVDGAETTKPRIEFAAALAKDHGAHLIGVGFAPTALLPLYGVDAGFADMSEVLQSVKSQGETALHACESHCEAQGVTPTAWCSWSACPQSLERMASLTWRIWWRI